MRIYTSSVTTETENELFCLQLMSRLLNLSTLYAVRMAVGRNYEL
jgi:hypothetical protein